MEELDLKNNAMILFDSYLEDGRKLLETAVLREAEQSSIPKINTRFCSPCKRTFKKSYKLTNTTRTETNTTVVVIMSNKAPKINLSLDTCG